MKEFLCNKARCRPWLPSTKTLLIMKLTSAFLLVLAMQVSASSYSQSVSLSGRNLPLKEVFNTIRNQTGFEFIYDASLIRSSRTVNVHVHNASVQTVLESCLQNLPLTYEIRFNTIIIKERPAGSNIINRSETQPVVNAPPVAVKGTVLDERTGLPVAGVSVGVKGASTGTVTDLDGQFTLMVSGNAVVLTFRHLSYETAEVTILPGKNIMVKLQAKSVQLSSTMVTTGMFKRPKENFNGAATTITGDQLRSVNALNVFQAAKIFDPSLRIPDNVQFGSNPNQLPSINLRGVNNFPQQTTSQLKAASGADFMASYASNPNQPLLILDGFETSLQKLYDLDINRIASFTILKDAAATSLYGSRAANGVIVVDTRQPLPGKLRVSYSGNLQVTAPDLSVYHLLNARDKLETERLAGLYNQYANDENNASLDVFYKRLYARRRTWVEQGVNTDWLAQPVRSGIGQKHSIYLEGGDDYLRYGLNLNYSNLAGVMKNSNRSNYGLEMNLSYRIKRFTFRNVLAVNYNKGKNSNYGSFGDYTKQNNYWSPFDSSGRMQRVLETVDATVYTNPLYNTTLHTVDQSEYTNVTNQSAVEWNMGKGFKLRGQIALTRQTDQADLFLPAMHTSFAKEADIAKRGSYTRDNSSFFSYDGSLNLDYSFRAGRHLLFNTTGVSAAETNSSGIEVVVTGFPSDKLDQLFFGNGYGADSKPGGNAATTRRVSGFTNVGYSYDQRYTLDAGISADGSSQFGADKRFAPFWNIGAGWNVAKEHFLPETNWLDQLRIRATIGSTGSSNFPPYMGITTYRYITDKNYRGQVGTTLLAFGNTNLQWQQTLKRNLGADISLFQGKLTGKFELYRENTQSLILDINTPPSSGVSSYKENVGELQNTGYEINLTAFAIKQDKKSIYWSFFVNGLHNKSVIKRIANSLKKQNDQNDKNNQTLPQLRFEEGQSPMAVWAVQSKGIDPANGRELFVTRSGELTYEWNARDKVIVGDQIPEIQGHFGTTASYKGLTLQIALDYQYHAVMYNTALADRLENGSFWYQMDARVLSGRWQKPGDVTLFKGLTKDNGIAASEPTNATSRFVQDNSFINLGSISLSYIVPERYTRKWKMNNTRVSFILNDVARWSSIQAERGLDYPFARNISLNIGTTF
ncbi:SusC/RagA family TonB-linked outer membrane protein [Chitinophaga flava]|nr:SusC/RagA family TonB-linked outer membrane protein [Chitinophaga flava]